MSLPSINFLHLTVSEIQPGQTSSRRPPAHPDTMGENNTPTALKGCGVKTRVLLRKGKEIVFVEQKQSVPMSINQFVEMTVFLCLICFSIYDKMQGFLDESGLFIFFIYYYYFFFSVLCRNSKWPPKWQENDFWEKSPVDSADNLRVTFCGNHSILLHFRDNRVFAQKFKMAAKSGWKTIFAKSRQ